MPVFCPNCGKENKQNDKFCAECGRELAREKIGMIKSPVSSSEDKSNLVNQPQNQDPPKKDNNNKLILGIVGACCVGLIILIVAAGLFTPDSNTSTVDNSVINPSNSNLKTYADSQISFQYPDHWTIYTPDDVSPEDVVNLKASKDGVSILTIYAEDAEGENVDYFKSIWDSVASDSGSTLISSEYTTVDGERAYEVSSGYDSTYGDGYQVMIGLVKNDVYYQIFFTTDNLSAIKQDISTVKNSFKVL